MLYIFSLFCTVIDKDEDESDDAMEVHLGLRLLDRVENHALSELSWC